MTNKEKKDTHSHTQSKKGLLKNSISIIIYILKK